MGFSGAGVLWALSSLVPGLARLLKDGAATPETLGKIAQQVTRLSGETEPGKVLRMFEENPRWVADLCQEMARLEAMEARDRLDARARDRVLVHRAGHNIRADIMVIAAALGLVGCLLVLSFCQGHLPGEAIGIISTIAGIFGSCLKDAYAFEFGSSRGSKAKDEQVTAVLMKKA